MTDPQVPPPYPDQPQPYEPVPPDQSAPYQPVPDQPAPYQPVPPDRSAPYQAVPPPGFDERGRVKRTKVSGVWIGLIAAAIVLILLIIFIAQNLNTVGLHFFGFYGKVSLGLALLVAAIAGILVAAVPGTVRILQLRKSLRRNIDLGDKNRP